MKAVVVFESLWGNTAAVAKAIADGLGPGTTLITTDVPAVDVVGDADLVVAGAPVFGFRLPTDEIRKAIARDETDAEVKPDLTHPSLRSWLAGLPAGAGRMAAFETRIWWSPRGATGDIERAFKRAGYTTAARAEKFVVRDKHGPLRDGELERAKAWGAGLAATVVPAG